MSSHLPPDLFAARLPENVNDPNYHANVRERLRKIEDAILQNHEPRLISFENFQKDFDRELASRQNLTGSRLSQLEKYKPDWDMLKQGQKDFDAWIKETEINLVDFEKTKLNVDDYKKEWSSIDLQLKHHDAKLA
jgi:hypothetical protein